MPARSNTTASSDTVPAAAHQQLLAAADEWGMALDGYPVAALLRIGQGDDGGSTGVVAHVLSHWLDHVEQQLHDYPPADTDVLAHLKSRLVQTRQALSDLLDLVLAHSARAAHNAWAPAAAAPRFVAMPPQSTH